MILYNIILYYILYLPTILLRPSRCGLVLYGLISMHKLTIYLLEDVTSGYIDALYLILPVLGAIGYVRGTTWLLAMIWGVHLISRRINELELRLDEWATISCESSWIKWAENTGMMCLSFAFTSEAYLTYIIYHHTSYIYIFMYICIYVYVYIYTYICITQLKYPIYPNQLLGRFIPLRLVEHLKDLAQWDGGSKSLVSQHEQNGFKGNVQYEYVQIYIYTI